MKIRTDVDNYMAELRVWLADTKDQELEEMGAFFSARIGGYEEHMAVWAEAYRRFARALPDGARKILDLGCGTGLELDEIYRLYPDVRVTGVDLCADMLEELRKKHEGKGLRTVCADYFQFDMEGDWDAVLSFESLHHFLPEKKEQLYRRISGALRPGAVFLLGDYIACCEEEEELLRRVYLEKRARFQIPEDRFVHFDIPLTLEHETELLYRAGFCKVSVLDSIEGATIVLAEK